MFDDISYLMGYKSAAKNKVNAEWELIAEKNIDVSTESTSATQVSTLDCGLNAWTSNKILYVKVRDNAGKKAGYFYGTDSFLINVRPVNSQTTAATYFARSYLSYDETWTQGNSDYGIYPSKLTPDGVLTLAAHYGPNASKIIDGNYNVKVYLLDWPNNISPFDD